MKNVQPGMNVGKQRRKFVAAIEAAPDAEHAGYLVGLLAMFDAGVAEGQPQPFSWFIPAYWEEFSMDGFRRGDRVVGNDGQLGVVASDESPEGPRDDDTIFVRFDGADRDEEVDVLWLRRVTTDDTIDSA